MKLICSIPYESEEESLGDSTLDTDEINHDIALSCIEQVRALLREGYTSEMLAELLAESAGDLSVLEDNLNEEIRLLARREADWMAPPQLIYDGRLLTRPDEWKYNYGYSLYTTNHGRRFAVVWDEDFDHRVVRAATYIVDELCLNDGAIFAESQGTMHVCGLKTAPVKAKDLPLDPYINGDCWSVFVSAYPDTDWYCDFNEVADALRKILE